MLYWLLALALVLPLLAILSKNEALSWMVLLVMALWGAWLWGFPSPVKELAVLVLLLLEFGLYRTAQRFLGREG